MNKKDYPTYIIGTIQTLTKLLKTKPFDADKIKDLLKEFYSEISEASTEDFDSLNDTQLIAKINQLYTQTQTISGESFHIIRVFITQIIQNKTSSYTEVSKKIDKAITDWNKALSVFDKKSKETLLFLFPLAAGLATFLTAPINHYFPDHTTNHTLLSGFMRSLQESIICNLPFICILETADYFLNKSNRNEILAYSVRTLWQSFFSLLKNYALSTLVFTFLPNLTSFYQEFCSDVLKEQTVLQTPWLIQWLQESLASVCTGATLTYVFIKLKLFPHHTQLFLQCSASLSTLLITSTYVDGATAFYVPCTLVMTVASIIGSYKNDTAKHFYKEMIERLPPVTETIINAMQTTMTFFARCPPETPQIHREERNLLQLRQVVSSV